MAARYLTVADLRVDLPVEYLGEANAEIVLSDALRAVGMMLYPGHPGRISSTIVQHVQVSWVGLEDEPASYAVGFSVRGPEERTYFGLGLLAPDEFIRRQRAIADALATGRNQSDWAPPWTVGDQSCGWTAGQHSRLQ